MVFEHAENAEAMVRTGRWKLVDSAGNRRRRDGYALGTAPPGRSIRLFDLEDDPGETTDVSGRSGNVAVVAELLARLADHLRHTARDPERVPATDDVHALLDQCLPPGESRR